MACCSLRCRQFWLLLWKNFVLQIRRPIGTAFEVILPLLAVIFVIGIRFGTRALRAEDRCFVTFPSDALTIPETTIVPYNIFYSPNDSTASDLAAIVAQKLPLDTVFTGFSDEQQMEAALTGLGRTNLSSCFLGGAGIVFDNLSTPDLEYTIRLRHDVGDGNSWFTRFNAPSFQLPGARVTNNFYFSEGFLHLQNVVGRSIVEWLTGEQQDITVAVRQMPYPSYRRDLFLQTVGSLLPLLLILSFLYSAGTVVKELVLEKETRIRESMLMMGLPQWVLWTTWYLKQLIFLLISIIIMAILLKVGRVFPMTNLLLLIVFLVLFILSMISFCFLVSVFFNSARIGLIMGFVLWLVNYFPYFFLPARFAELSLAAKVCACLLSNTCVGLGVEVLARLELREVGWQFSNFASPLSLDDDFNMAWVCGMLALDAIAYMLAAWYINAVKPGEYGVPRPLWFPFLPSYWTGRTPRTKLQEAQSLVEAVAGGYEPSAHEEEPDGLEAGVTIQNLTKVYNQNIFTRLFSSASSRREHKASRRVAVNTLSLNMYRGQITALLGHNGAGKTTTMAMLTGLYTPTTGNAIINGYSILDSMDEIRQNLGICPQHNVLFDRLTVQEHLRFFSRLKGLSGERMREEVRQMVADLQLVGKEGVAAAKLSGGMKRKLSVGIALVGGSEVVILDEPTSGMDPYARRATWDLLVKYKPGRTMLLTTHFMDEADLLGDRIAILAEGKLRCSGSSLFLKSRYGVGYHMTIVKEASCSSSRVAEVVQSMVSQAEQVTDVGAELSFILPSSATPHFPQLFDTLEARKAELGISAFGVSITTMEEVFMKVGEGTDEALDARLRGAMSPRATSPLAAGLAVVDVESPVAEEEEEEGMEERPSTIDVAETAYLPRASNASELPNEEQRKLTGRDRYDYIPNTGAALWMQQFWAMFVKRFFNSVRFYGSAILQLVIPVMFVLFGLVVVVTVPSNTVNDPPRTLTLRSSALSIDNITLFYAHFGDSFPVNFSKLQAADFNVNELFDYTDDVQSIIDRVEASPPSQASQCCAYQHQLLDQYCASQTPASLMNACEDVSDFGYDGCSECLSCCGATEAKVQTCTNPFTLLSEPSVGSLCPSPPPVTVGTQPNGAIDSENTFVAEHLLNLSTSLQPSVFFGRFLAGFVMSSRDPPYSVCGCSDGFSAVEELRDSKTCDFISPLQPVMGEEQCPTYKVPLSEPCQFGWFLCLLTMNCTLRDAIPGCSELEPGLGSGGGSANDTCDATLPGCYTVDGVSYGILEAVSCNQGRASELGCNKASNTSRPVGRFSPQQEEQISATVWYSNQPFHAPPAALNAFHSTWLQQAMGDDTLSITVNNHPLPRNPETEIDDASQNFIGFGVSTLVVFGYSFLLASFVLFLVKEKETKAKHLQFVSGVHVTSYWLATFAWDLLNALLPVILSVILFAVFQIDAYSGVNIAAIFLLLVFTCWAAIPLTYCVSFIFSNSLAAYALLVVAFFLGAVLMETVVILVDDNVAEILHYIFLTFPTYGLAIGLNDIYTNSLIRNLCTSSESFRQLCALPGSGISFTDSPLDFLRPGVGSILTYMAVEGVLLFVFPMIIERSFFFPELRRLFVSSRQPVAYAAAAEPLLHGEDSDVYAERKKVLSGGTEETDVVVIKNLVKTYGTSINGCSIRRANTAVRGISLALPNGQCFGLLGVNGAGKTTTFGILTGDKSMSSGTAVIAGYDIRNNLRKVQQRIGYCPQFDGLIERLTGRELLTMFARLRGVPEKQIKDVVATEIRRLDLSKHANKRCGNYSGGNKRKLSTAIALVGNPPIVLLDEPTTGMDPTTRRYLWDVLTGVTQEGRTIVLTSHSMEECEALCTRLAIMVNGSFKCLGGVQHLKNKYGAGYTLQAKVKLSPSAEPPPLLQRGSSKRLSLRRSASNASRSKSPQPKSPSHSAETETAVTLAGGGAANSVFNPYDTTSLHIFIREAFPTALLLEEHQGAVTYQLPSAGVSWSSVFRQLESNKERLGIIDYSVSQTSLEQVFINFAKEQNEESALL